MLHTSDVHPMRVNHIYIHIHGYVHRVSDSQPILSALPDCAQSSKNVCTLCQNVETDEKKTIPVPFTIMQTKY